MTWSLAVEEQFYLVFPILLMLLHRRARKHIFHSPLAGCALSLLLSVYAEFRHPEFNFYLPVTRAWELGAGTLPPFGKAALEALATPPDGVCTQSAPPGSCLSSPASSSSIPPRSASQVKRPSRRRSARYSCCLRPEASPTDSSASGPSARSAKSPIPCISGTGCCSALPPSYPSASSPQPFAQS
jgi:hypothetical protein